MVSKMQIDKRNSATSIFYRLIEQQALEQFDKSGCLGFIAKIKNTKIYNSLPSVSSAAFTIFSRFAVSVLSRNKYTIMDDIKCEWTMTQHASLKRFPVLMTS